MASTLPFPPSPDARSASRDEILVRRIRAGEAAAFETLFREYFVRLARFALTYVDTTEAAEDVVQDVLLRIWQGREDWEIHGTVQSYLYAAVRHRAINHLRRRRLSKAVDDDASAAAADDGVGWGGAFSAVASRTDAPLDASDLEAAIERAIAELPERCRETFVLSRQHELSQAEIAAIMGTSIKTVQAQMYKARNWLRVRLADWLAG